MKCKNHPDRETSRTCDGCGSAFCDDCLIEVRGRSYCQSCAQELINRYKNEKQKQEQREKEKIEAERADASAAKQTTQKKSGCLGCAINLFMILITISAIISLIIILYV